MSWRLELARRVKISSAALLVTAAVYLLLGIDIVWEIGNGAPVNVMPQVMTGCCLAPFAVFLIRLTLRSRRDRRNHGISPGTRPIHASKSKRESASR